MQVKQNLKFIKKNSIMLNIMTLNNQNLFALFVFLFTFLGTSKSQDIVLDLRKANQLLSIAQERDRISSEALEEVKSRRLRIDEDLTFAQDNPKSLTKEEKTKLESEVKALRLVEAELNKKRKYANNLLADVTDILQATPKKRAKFISEYENHFGEIKLTQTAENQVVITSKSIPSDSSKKNNDPIVQVESAPSNPSPSVSQNDVKLSSEIKTEPVQEKKEPQKKSKKKTNTENVMVKEVPKTVPPKKQKAVKLPKNPPTETVFVIEEKAKTEVGKKPKPEKKSKNTLKTEDIAIAADEPKPTVPSKKPKNSKNQTNEKPRNESSKSNIVYKKFDAKEDVMMLTPTNLDCNLAFDGMDNFTGKKKQETTPIVLFAHTDDFMRAAMKDKEFVSCDATATRVEGSRTVYLNLTITIQTKDAQRSFGFLDRGAFIIFRFINGRKLSLATNKTDIGVVDVDKGTTTFRAQLAISETVEFTASELDAIRVSWSIGYEDYEIFDMDVLRNLFKCLDKSK